jgi:hypothetical protein
LASHPLAWLSLALASAVIGAAIMTAAQQRTLGTSAPSTAFVGS